jgi:threonine dehydratase
VLRNFLLRHFRTLHEPMIEPPSLIELEAAAQLVYRALPATPQFAWPLLGARLGCEVWVKHENHMPTGAFKVRGGLVYFARLKEREPELQGVISATRGNHGQSIAFAARRHGVAATIVVPYGNSVEKNAAMRAQGATLIEHGDDFQEAREFAGRLAAERGLHMVPSFHRDLLLGVASYCMEFLRAAPALDTVYVPIGMGSGACAMIAARDALGLSTEVVGVVSTLAPAYALSFAAHRSISHPVTTKLADGMAVRSPDDDALDMLQRGAARMVLVDDGEVAAAMRALFADTHNVAEGAGAAAVAAATQERQRNAGRKIGVVLSGGNVDTATFAAVLSGNA